MPHTLRIGIQIEHVDPFWVQVREVMWRRAQTLSAELIEINIQESHALSADEQAEVVEDLIVQELDALLCNTYPPSLLGHILDRGIPIIYVSEIALQRPRFTSRVGLYDAARMLGVFLHERLAGHGRLLIVGGHSQNEDTGQSRLDGFAAGLAGQPGYVFHYVPCEWNSATIGALVAQYLGEHPDLQLDAIFGLSDSLALTARDTAQAHGRIGPQTLILGINGDPLALAAIADGSMTATVETDVEDIATQAINLAHQAARGQPTPAHFQHRLHLISAENVADASMRRLLSLATLPTHLIEINRRNEQQRLVQLATNQAIDRQIGLILDEQQLSLAITALIRDSYGFDHARFLAWNPQTNQLTDVGATRHKAGLSTAPAGPLAYALAQNQLVFIPDTRASHRFAPDPAWPATSSRVVAPVRLGGQIIGLLDLHRHSTTHHTREELNGLQLLADRLGISVRNAELYGHELAARALAEKADQLKTRLLANVSHELRTPLNVILGYSSAALSTPNPYATELPAALIHDLQQVYHSGEHLIHVINDLLDLSRAEIDELDLFPEPINTSVFLADVFQGMANSAAHGDVQWRLELRTPLPLIQADPVRLRQILLNLLSNASKFTRYGTIVLGADLEPPHLHLWVGDTGAGIPIDLQTRIFEPFVTGGSGKRRQEGAGVGLGLSISRRLVALHGGSMSLESQPGCGSTFHIYLPLPSVSGQIVSIPAGARPTLVLLGGSEQPATQVAELCQRQGWGLAPLAPGDDLEALLSTIQPVSVAWNLEQASLRDWSLIQQIRSMPQLSQLPLIVYGQAQPTQAGLSAGLTSFLVKPLSRQSLIEGLNALRPAEADGSVLIVDDDPQALHMYQGIVAGALPNYSIYTADGGVAAIERLAAVPPSLVILDLMMPEIDGFAVIEHMRGQPQLRRVPVLVMSGRTLTFDDIRRLDHAFVTFHSKAIISTEETAASLHRALSGADALPQQTSTLVKHALAYLQQYHSQPISRQELATAIGVSKDYLSHIFHQELGFSPWEYLNRYRIQQAKTLLRATNRSITEIATQVGFDDLSYFSRVFNKHTGCSPRAYREQSR